MLLRAHRSHEDVCKHLLTISRSACVVRVVFPVVRPLLGMSQSFVQEHPLMFPLHANHVWTSAGSRTCVRCCCFPGCSLSVYAGLAMIV